MLGKILSFIVGLVVTAILGLAFAAAIFSTSWDKWEEKKADRAENKVTGIRVEYDLNVREPAGVLVRCPICKKDFIKGKSNFCCPQHEKEYWEMEEAWETIQGLPSGVKY